MTRAVYATRERVMRAADIRATAYVASEIDSALQSSSQAVDDLCMRGDAIRPGFAPWEGTITFDWPISNNDNPYRFYLNRHTLLTADSATSGGVDISSALLPWPEYGPPYRALDVDQGSGQLLTFVTGIGQRSLDITGTWGETDAERTLNTWTLGAALSSTTATTATLNAPFGVGSILRIGTERMWVTERAWATSGQTGSLTRSAAAQTLAVSDGTAFLAGEELLIDAERLLIRDIAGNNLVVQRAQSGSTLAEHTLATIYWSRSCTVERGVLGTAAATHSNSAQIYLFTPPSLCEQLTVAYTLNQREQESSAYARTVGSGDSERAASGRGIAELEKQVLASYGRQLRHRAVGG
jgi:hypothetical protein